jgi:multiple sugar transport system permease protein
MTTLRRTHDMRRRERLFGLLFVAPIGLQVILFCVVPIGIAVVAGFTNWNVIKGTYDFIGLDNFVEFLTDKYFWIATGNTVYMLIPGISM